MNTLHKRIQHWLLRYGFAVIMVAVATLLYQQFGKSQIKLPLYIFYYPSIMAAFVVGGFGPGLVAILLSAACAGYFFIPPVGQFKIDNEADALGLAVFFIMGLGIGDLLRKRQAAESRQADAYNRNLIETSLDPLVTISPDGYVTDVNSATEAVTGWLRDELIGTEFADYFTDPMMARAAYHQAFLTGSVRDYALDIRHRDGHLTPVLYNASVYRDESGAVAGVFAAARDITNRKRTEDSLRKSQELFSLFMRYSPIFTYIKQVSPTESRVLQASDNFQQMVGISGHTMIGKTMAELFPDELATKISADDWAVVVNGEVLELDEDFNGRNYTTIKFPIVLGGEALVAGYTIDITERKLAESEQRKISERFSLACRAGGIGIWELDAVNDNLIWDAQMFKLYGITPDKFSGTYEDWRSGVHPDDVQQIEEEFQMAMRGEKDFDTEFRVVWPDGTTHTLRALANLQKDDSGQAVGLVGTNYEITELKCLQEKLRKQATTDELTGIANRRRFLELAYTETRRASRLKHTLTVALIDIDHFKLINDTYGHATGDRALLGLTRVCRENIREIDVFARFGGDEFILLLPEISSERACDVMERICIALSSKPLDLGDKLVWITISTGIASFACEGDSLDLLLERADQALYRAKEAGRNCVMVDYTFKTRHTADQSLPTHPINCA